MDFAFLFHCNQPELVVDVLYMKHDVFVEALHDMTNSPNMTNGIGIHLIFVCWGEKLEALLTCKHTLVDTTVLYPPIPPLCTTYLMPPDANPMRAQYTPSQYNQRDSQLIEEYCLDPVKVRKRMRAKFNHVCAPHDSCEIFVLLQFLHQNYFCITNK